MKNKYGPTFKAIFLLFETYKSVIRADRRLGAENEFINTFDEYFYYNGDIIDSYIERIFDIMAFPKCPLLRNVCGELILDFLTETADFQTVMKAIFTLKEAHEKDEEGFHKKFTPKKK